MRFVKTALACVGAYAIINTLIIKRAHNDPEYAARVDDSFQNFNLGRPFEEGRI